jgi:hypothetical protein
MDTQWLIPVKYWIILNHTSIDHTFKPPQQRTPVIMDTYFGPVCERHRHNSHLITYNHSIRMHGLVNNYYTALYKYLSLWRSATGWLILSIKDYWSIEMIDVRKHHHIADTLIDCFLLSRGPHTKQKKRIVQIPPHSWAGCIIEPYYAFV